MTRTMRKGWPPCGVFATVAWLVAAAQPVHCAVAPRDYHDVDVSLPAQAALPRGVSVTDEAGHRRALGDLVLRPAVLVFADYTCRTLCGPVVAFVAGALEQSGLRAGEQFRLIVVGLDPKDTAADAERMRHDHLGGDAALNAATTFVMTDKAAIDRITSALGYRYVYDKEHDQFVHPGAAFVLQAGGRVARVLSGLGLSGDDMRLALVEASEGHVGTWRDHVRLLCSGFDPAHGTYNLVVSRVLAASALVTILVLGGGIGLLILAGRRRAA